MKPVPHLQPLIKFTESVKGVRARGLGELVGQVAEDLKKAASARRHE